MYLDSPIPCTQQAPTSLTWPTSVLHPWWWRFFTKYSTSPYGEGQEWLHSCRRCCWLHRKPTNTGKAWIKSSWHFNSYGTPLVKETQLAIWPQTKWDVHQWSWKGRCCTVLKRVFKTLAQVQEMNGHIQQQWQNWYHTSWFSSPSRHSVPPDSSHTQWINLLCTWLTEKSVPTCNWQSHTTTKGGRPIDNDCQHVDIGMGETKGQWWVSFIHLIFCFKLTLKCSEAHVVFKVGKNCNRYFSCEDLLKQVEYSIDIFESKTNGFTTGLFILDNAPSHQKHVPNALSAHKMPKNPNKDWSPKKDGLRMRNRKFGPSSTLQDFYFPEDHATMPGWFKGMGIIIHEQGLWPMAGLRAQCNGFKCEAGQMDCYCQHVMFSQPDFMAQKSLWEVTFVTSTQNSIVNWILLNNIGAQ